MTTDQLDDLYRPLAQQLHEGHMQRLGIAATMRLAHTYNQAKFGVQDSWRRWLYQAKFAALLEENGPLTRTPLEFKDGWALDASLSLPNLDDVLEEGDKIIAERGGVRKTAHGAYRSYFQDIWTADDAVNFPAFLNFATSSDVLAVVGQYLQCIPALSTTLPSGVRVVESNAEFDDDPEHPKDSQLYHIDYYSLPNVYVLVLLRDTTIANGPWTFLPRTLSQIVKAALNYWQHGCGYRVSDEQVYAVADKQDAIEFCYPRGTVLFIESSGCFHYGSRNSVMPRHQIMLGYTGACRTDFSEVFMKRRQFPIRDGDSLLRRLVLDKYAPAPGQTDDVDPEKLPFLLETYRQLTAPTEFRSVAA